MDHSIPVGLAKWYQFVAEHDAKILAEALADDVVFHSPALWRPREGKALTMVYLQNAAKAFETFTYQRTFFAEDGAVLEFSATIGALGVKGVDLLQFNQDGLIKDFEVMVRPATALQALAATMAQLLNH